MICVITKIDLSFREIGFIFCTDKDSGHPGPKGSLVHILNVYLRYV